MFEQFLIGAVSALAGVLLSNGVNGAKAHKLTGKYIQCIQERSDMKAELVQTKHKEKTLAEMLNEKNRQYEQLSKDSGYHVETVTNELDLIKRALSQAESIKQDHMDAISRQLGTIEEQQVMIDNLTEEVQQVKQNFVQMAEAGNTEINRLNSSIEEYKVALNDAVQKNASLIEMLEKLPKH